MIINWYPGHMKKTKELIIANLKLVDVVVELLDARIPIGSRNPQIDELVKNKDRIILLNKKDLSDPKLLMEWVKYFQEKGIKAIPINSVNGDGVKDFIKEIRVITQPLMDKLIAKGRTKRAVRMMIVGIPNVGKSSLINTLVGKKVAKTGNKPGVTKGKQWIRVREDIELFDTPGILWPKIEDQELGRDLAFTGAISDDAINIEDLSFYLVKKLMIKYPDAIKNRYKIDTEGKETVEILDLIGRSKMYIDKQKDVDYFKVAQLLLTDFRSKRLGNITLESPDEFN